MNLKILYQYIIFSLVTTLSGKHIQGGNSPGSELSWMDIFQGRNCPGWKLSSAELNYIQCIVSST